MNSETSSNPVDFCYLGQHEYAVDAQRRVALPKCWRQEDADSNRFYLLPGRGKSLQLVPAEMFRELLTKLRKVSFADRQAAVALATIGSMAEEVCCDRQGRIALSPQLLVHAGIGGKALLIGAVTTIQIWDPTTWQANQMDSETCLDVLQAIQERHDDLTEILRSTTKSSGE